jgi:hypothetical protein
VPWRTSAERDVLLPLQTDVRPWFAHALIALLALALGLSFGLSYGLETHTSYLLHPLRNINPTFLQFDWLAAHTELVHESFALIRTSLCFFLYLLDYNGKSEIM